MKLTWPGNKQFNHKQATVFSSMGILNWISLITLLVGVVIVLMFGASNSSKATIFLWMLACLLTGSAIGFLFGIPKILQNTLTPVTGATKSPTYQQQVNTNLTEISDWLTKIIVGLGLVNLNKLSPCLRSVANILAKGLSEPNNSPSSLAFSFAYGTIVMYFILGFLFGYIITRLYLAGAFSEADQKAISIITKQTEEAVGAANSALHKAEFALAKPSEISLGDLNPGQTLTELAQNYVETRNQMPSGFARTSKMGQIFKSMINAASTVEEFDISTALKEEDIGKRLTGYAYLYVRPDWNHLPDLIDSITTDTTPFGQYWGIQTLRKVLESKPGNKMDQKPFEKLKTFYNSLKKGIDREYELRKILPELSK